MLTREQVLAVYTRVLGRPPSEAEIAERLAADETLDDLLRIALDSEEYAVRLRGAGDPARDLAVVNIFHPDLADWGLQPGTRSSDEIAIVGHDGWLFLCGGTNSNLGQHLGRVEMSPGWPAEWRELIERRGRLAEELGVASALLVVPDKLAAYEAKYPEELEPLGPRPIERLLERPAPPVLYPLEDLRRAAATGEETYLRTDTHLTFRGNEVLFRSVLADLGVEEAPDFAELPFRSYPIAGDLGSKFDPEIVSIVTEPGTLHRATMGDDNRDEIAAVRGHIGTRRVFRNERSPDPRVLVLFGDSFGFAAPYYQGLAWFLAQVFREVHFLWIPFGWDSGYVRRVGAEAVVVQGAERFLGRVPRLEVDFSKLVEDTLRRGEPVGIEGVSEG